MIHLISEAGLDALRALTAYPVLYAFDFDGTLAPISSDRERVAVPRSVAEWLKELSKRVPCAIVSGRGIRDLAGRIDGLVPHLIGNHGIESPSTSPVALAWCDGICAGWRRILKDRLTHDSSTAGIELEDKRYSLTLHYRQEADPIRVRSTLTTLVDQLNPAPRVIVGKQSVNLLPPGKGGKGVAALGLMRHLNQRGLFYVGDDETDEDVFELEEGLVMGVRVGREVRSRARYYVKHPGELEEALRFLVHRIDYTPESAARSHLR
ncbi:MAG: trehalose-phosphatase [Nitrospira sp.]